MSNNKSGLFFIFNFFIKIYLNVLDKWKMYTLVFITFFILAFVFNSIRKLKYTAEVTFIIDESKPMSLSALSSVISSQLGADLGGASGLLMGDNILELLKSRSIFKKIMIRPSGNKYGSLANHYIQSSGMEKGIIKKYDINPSSHFDFAKASVLVQDSLIRVIHEMIFKNNVVVFRVDKKMSFVKVRCVYNDEEFAKQFVDQLVAEVSDYYIKMKTAKSRLIVEKIQHRADSLYDILKGKTYSSAFKQSRSTDLNPFFSDVIANVEMNARDKQITLTVYTEVIKNLEIAKMNLSQDTPAVQIIDSTEYPLKSNRIGFISKSLLAITFSLFMCVLIYISGYLKNTYKSIKKDLSKGE